MLHSLTRWASSQLHDWDHRVTMGGGLAFALAPSVELLTRLLGLVALLIGIYCSVSRERREARAERARNGRS